MYVCVCCMCICECVLCTDFADKSAGQLEENFKSLVRALFTPKGKPDLAFHRAVT